VVARRGFQQGSIDLRVEVSQSELDHATRTCMAADLQLVLCQHLGNSVRCLVVVLWPFRLLWGRLRLLSYTFLYPNNFSSMHYV